MRRKKSRAVIPKYGGGTMRVTPKTISGRKDDRCRLKAKTAFEGMTIQTLFAKAIARFLAE